MHDLKKFGILIHYYRIKKDYLPDEFIIDDIDNYIICSRKTFSRVESGLSNTIEYYDIFAQKLNRKILLYKPDIDKVESIISSLINAIEEMSITKMKNILNDIKTLNLNKHYLYYYECISLCTDIINYHLKNIIPNQEQIEIYNEMLKIEDIKLSKLILYFLYTISNINTITINRAEIINKIDKHIDDPIFFNRKLTNIVSSNTHFNAYYIIEKMLENESHNQYQKAYLIYVKSLCLLNTGENHQAFELLTQLLTDDFKSYIPNDLEIKIYSALAICAYSIKEYKIACKYYKKTFDSNYLKINYNFLLYFDSLQKLNEYETIHSLINSVNLSNISNRTVEYIFRYFHLKYQTNIEMSDKIIEMTDILIDELKPIKKFGDAYSNVLNEELYELFNLSTNYKRARRHLKYKTKMEA